MWSARGITPFIAIFIALQLFGCANKMVVSDVTCGILRKNLCIGKITAPPRISVSIQAGTSNAIDAIYSSEFEKSLYTFYNANARKLKHFGAWSEFDASLVVAQLRLKVLGVEIDTYGGALSYLMTIFAGNMAFDGVAAGPIRMNEWALPRAPASVANTVAHEVAHRVGLTHPSSNVNLSIARCEPPYVVGSLVEAIIEGKALPSGSGHCDFFKTHMRED